MRGLITKYPGECRKCAKEIEIGAEVVYEKRVGIFCPTCAPTDPEEIRTYRQEGADRKAERLEEWADKRNAKAAALLKQNEPYRGDHAFNTQPGHIPERARANRRDDAAFAHMDKAQDFEARAANLRSGVRVAGDAARRDAEKREKVRSWVKPGDIVFTYLYDNVEVVKVNQKTAKIKGGRDGSGGQFNVDLIFIERLVARKEGAN